MFNFFRNLCLFVLTEQCFDEFFLKFNFFNGPCLKAALSKCLGLAIVGGSVLVKVPQIIKIISAKSAQGINLFGTSLEIFAMVGNVSYNFVNKYPFSAYGDGVFVLIQTTIIGSMVLHYGGSAPKSLLYAATIMTSTYILCSGVVPLSVQWMLTALNIPIVFSAKMAQAWTNFQNRSTGQLSAITLTLLFSGTLARIFTSIQETGDSVLIWTYIIATVANGILLGQLVYYWNVGVKKTRGKKKVQ